MNTFSFFLKNITLIACCSLHVSYAQNVSHQDLKNTSDKLPTIEKNSDIAALLYQSLGRKNWGQAKTLLRKYEHINNADKLLISYARGCIARADGDYTNAIKHLQLVIKNTPKEFLLPRLALGRAEFEDHRNKQSQKTFENISLSLDAQNVEHQGILQTIDLFQKELSKRKKWQGSFALTVGTDNNLNQTPNTETCLQEVQGLCLQKRKSPKPIHAQIFSYEGSINRRIVLLQNHGLFINSSVFGDLYKDNSLYNNGQVTLSTGYSYKDSNSEFSVYPSFTHINDIDSDYYNSLALHSSLTQSISEKQLLRLDASVEKQLYPQQSKHLNGNLYNARLQFWQMIGYSMTPFMALGLSKKTVHEKIDSYKDKNMTLGVTYNYSDITSSTIQVSKKNREYQGFSAFLGEQRKDNLVNYSLSITSPKLEFLGFKPQIKYTHIKNTSNVDWMFSYKSNKLELRLENQF